MLCREQAKQRYLQASPASRDLGSLAVLCGCLLRWPPSRRKPVGFVKQLARLHVFDVDLKKAPHDLADFFDNSAFVPEQGTEATQQEWMRQIAGEKVLRPSWPRVLAAEGAWPSIAASQVVARNQAIREVRAQIGKAVCKHLV